MTFIRTQDGVWLNGGTFGYPCERIVGKKHEYDWGVCFDKKDIIKQANTINLLCDRFVVIYENEEPVPYKNYLDAVATQKEVYGAIWCEWGLKYVAKINKKGELELL